jgi:2-polyprenyl-6-methoxyphenol hydroxylase-like FAD-dependent oxidoreductase
MTIRDDFDVVIVGAGVAGGALATRLARDGMSVLVLERTLIHIDRIRGEWLAPWGVLEAKQLGVLDDLLAAGGHYITKSMRYGDGIPIEAGRMNPLDLAALIPGVPGVMTIGHPCVCDTLDQTAKHAGATLLRGVNAVSVEPGLPPAIAFEHEGERHTLRPRLVVAADGRGSSLGRQIGAEVQTEPVHHLIAELLIENVHAWPQDEQAVSVHGDLYLLVFPQGHGRMRLYLCYPLEERGRFSGPRAAENFLEAFRVPTLPHAGDIANGRIAGPCQGIRTPIPGSMSRWRPGS